MRRQRLIYSDDSQVGIGRRRHGRGFVYPGPDGRPVRDPKVLKRIAALVIPPAWTDVWICPLPHGHIQATGRDAKGRKQYLYHTDWLAFRNEQKFDRVLDFAQALPRLRRQVEADLARQRLGRRKVTATVVRLLEWSLIRVGNAEYASRNGSFGLTTLTGKHVEVGSTRILFEFTGKSGKEHKVEVRDARLARIMRRCQELPGQRLFRYRGRDGRVHAISSTDVNDYIRRYCGPNFSAKDFRTWHATVLAAAVLSGVEPGDTEHATNRALVGAVKKVARQLGNTPAVCRSSYIHPRLLEDFSCGCLDLDFAAPSRHANPVDARALSSLERKLVGYLQRA